MKVGALVELVYQKVNAGRLGTDTNVERIDIKEYLPAAINTAIRDNNVLSLKMGAEDRLLSEQFIATFENVAVQTDSERGVKFIEFPKKPIMFRNSDYVTILPKAEGEDPVEFKYMRNRTQLKGYGAFTGMNTFYWMEGNKAFFKNISNYVRSVNVQMILAISDMNDDDDAPIPFGYEEAVLVNCDKWFTSQRSMPADDKVDNTENLNKR